MDLTPYVDQLRRDLANAADAAGPEIATAAERLAVALDPSARIVLLDALATAADEVTAALQTAVVELRLRGREPQLVVQEVGTPPEPPAAPAPPAPETADDGATSRVSLRLPDALKTRAEEAAAAAGVSLNTWLVRVVAAAIDGDRPAPGAPGRTGRRLSGWARA